MTMWNKLNGNINVLVFTLPLINVSVNCSLSAQITDSSMLLNTLQLLDNLSEIAYNTINTN